MNKEFATPLCSEPDSDPFYDHNWSYCARWSLSAALALVDDKQLLRYLIKDAKSDIEILPHTIERPYCHFGMKPGFGHSEILYLALLSDTGDTEWGAILNRYLDQH